MKKTILKVVSFLYCICMLVGCLPMKTYATDGSVSEIIISCNESSVTHTNNGTSPWSSTTNASVVYPGAGMSYNTQSTNYSAIYDLSSYVGTYDLYAYNVTRSTDQTNVKVSISQAGYNVVMGSWDQKNTGDHTWVALGTYTLDANSYVSFTNTSDLRMRDAAIKLVPNNSGTPITPAITMNEGSEIIITSDKATRNSDGGWTVIEKIIVAGPTGKYAYTTSTAKDNVTYPLGNFEGKYTLFVYNRCNNVDNHQKEVSVAVTYADGSKSTNYDQTGNSDASWVELGTYTFDNNSSVTFTNSSAAHMRDTAIKLVPVTEESNPVAQIEGGEKYETLEGAIEAAVEGNIIKLLGDVTLEKAITLSKITLDLNGKTLTAPSLTSFGGNVVDKSDEKTGVLKATFVPAENNSQMPIYNGTGYMFIDFKDIKRQEDGGEVSKQDVFELIFRPSFGKAVNTALASLGNDAQVKFIIRLEWKDANGNSKSQDLYYSDAMVEQVYREKMAFSITASGVSNFTDLTITPLVQSTLKEEIKWLGNTYLENQ